MTISLVQAEVMGDFDTDVQGTFDAPPTEGNFLVVVASHRSGDVEPSSISGSGWSAPIHTKYDVLDVSNRRMETMWWKYASASEPSTITVTYPSSVTAAFNMVELDLDGLVVVYEATDPNDVGDTAVVSLLSGTLTPSAVPALAISSLIIRESFSALSFDDSYTKMGEHLGGVSGMGQATSFKELLSVVSTDTTATWTSSRVCGHTLHMWVVLVPTQTIRPDADVTRVDWVDEGAGTSNLWDGLDETSTSDADYITVSV